MMASYSPANEGWFGERGVHQGIGLDILFSGRDFNTPNLYSPNDTLQLQEAKSHYACPRAPQRSLHGWGTYSPPPQKPSPSTESRGGASSAARPASLNQCLGYHTLPRRALAVFRPCVYSSPQGYNTTTVDKPRMLRATITSSPSDSNHPVQHQSQDQKPRPNQQQVIKQQHQPSLSPKPVYQPSLSPKPVYQPSLSPMPVYQPSLSPKPVYQPSLSPKPVYQPSLSPKPVYQPSLSPKPVYQPSLSPKPVYQPSLSPMPVYQPSLSPKPVYQPSLSLKPVYQPSLSPKPVYQPSLSPKPVYQPSLSLKPVYQPSLSPKPVYRPSLSPKPVYQPSLSPMPVYRRLTTWQHKDNTNTDSNTIKTNNSPHSNSIKRQVDMTSQNVFGQPRVLASLRGPPFARQTHKTSNLEEELRRLIILDNTSEDSGRDASCRHSLSTEISLGRGPLDSSLACSPVSDCPELEGLEDLSASELSLTEGWDPGHIPLLDPTWSLEWSKLVNAAKAYEAQRTVEPIHPSKPKKHGSEGGPAACPPNHYPPHGYNALPTLRSEVPSDLSRLHHLEVLLRHLESNLEKERQDKEALMEEVTILRETNRRLWEESLSSNEQLRKLSLLFNRNDA
ncbi:signal-induced proliferation-associated 1-like protein 3 isoform X1 [Coregonus clupeaformis]|uniref:signal-induced proliferation-associated 1-like protein 3 isoform X1 n=1 Tax=Coregonus clupeaformis TaxID=59861 RepID=UPI001E1C88F4|nr:signal-induced proliferation-associated 1-like protein 3 isoform X1 [Coregonus clupeaformis]